MDVSASCDRERFVSDFLIFLNEKADMEGNRCIGSFFNDPRKFFGRDICAVL